MFDIFKSFFDNKYQLSQNKCFLWDSDKLNLIKISNFKCIPSSLLIGINYQKNIILENTKKFAEGYRSNNALLWGVRGNGKSTLIKSLFNELSEINSNLKMIQLSKNNLKDIIKIYNYLEKFNSYQFIIFIDDLSFEEMETDYKIIKSALDGNIKEQPNNVIIYATSNRRHLMHRDMIDNERSSAIHTDESIEEKVSLSDRFGLWIGFHNISQSEYLEMIKNYANYFKLEINDLDLKKSIEWSITRGNRTGRCAWQYIIEIASNKEIKINF